MSLIPEFELGLWNAWILILPIIILSALLTKMLVKRESGRIQDSGLANKERIIFTMHHLIFLASCAYTIFLPLKLGTFWFFAGLLSYLLGMLVVILGLLSFYATPIDNPVTKGVYSISRNPMYVGNFFTNMGITMACHSWVFLLVTIVAIILENNIVTGEERTCLKLYGDAYREYMNRTPKWIGIPRSRKR